MKIGIIGAMDIEVDGIKQNIENCKVEKISDIEFCYGKICGKDVVVAKCGEGKVNAAITAQTMILQYNPDCIVNTGVAGGLHADMKVLDVAVADDVCQHDFDLVPLGYDAGFVPRAECVYMPCDEGLSDRIEVSAKRVCSSSVFRGTIASGDQFIASDVQRNRIKEVFGAIAAEMEGASIGQVCRINNKKFTVLRVMSDCADGSADMSFDAFAKAASDISVKIILDFIRRI